MEMDVEKNSKKEAINIWLNNHYENKNNKQNNNNNESLQFRTTASKQTKQKT